MLSPSPGRAIRWLGYRVVPRRPLASVLGMLALAWVSVAVSLYYSSAAASPATRPSHAWTSVDEVDSLLPLRPDIAVRQVWVCGPWMQALDARTLLAALAVQDRLVAYEKTVDDGAAVTVAVHSILDSWGRSAERISADSDILDTLRRASGRRSQAGVTLLPESTLGGFVASPSLGDGPAVAADAVGITLLSDDGSEAGRVWDHGAAALVRDQAGWHASWMEETQGTMVRIQYYPAGVADNIAFLALYGAAALHAWAHLAGLTVLKSRLWLLTFILAEVISVTLLARVISSSVGINVSTVPPAVYPLFALGQCLANALRLVDQVSRTGQREVSQRVSLALIRLGAAPFLVTAQAVVMLLLAARFAPSAGLSGLCWFATISLTLDLLAFFTFFVAALAVDLKSPGIQDSVDEDRQSGSSREKIRPISYQYRRQGHQSEVPRRLGSGAPRLAPDFLVTLGLICFVALHFIDGGVLPPSHKVEHVSKVPRRSFPSHIPAEANNPVVWLQAQSPQTLHEFLQAVKPQSSSFVARVHTPLLVVTDAAARNASLAAAGGSSSGSQSGVPPLALGALVLALVLLGCVHFGDAGGKGREAVNGNERDGDVSLTQCLARHHELDIFILVSCSRRFLVSVGFDRQVRLWDLEAPTPDSTLILPTDDVPNPVGWPIALVAIDNHAEWLALCARDGRVALWSRRTRRFGRTVTLEPGDRVVACFFVAAPHSPRGGRHMPEVTTTTTTMATATTTTRLLLVLRTGRLLDLDVDGAGAITAHKICDDTVRSSHVSSTSTGGPSQASALKLVTITQGEPVFVSVNREGWWTTRPLRITAVSPRQLLSSSPVPGQRRPMRFSVVESLRGVALLYDEGLGALHLVDMLSDALIYTFHRRVALRGASLRALHPPSRQCASCGSIAMASFSVAYTEKGEKNGGGGGTFAMTTVAVATPTRPVMCLRAERDARERRCVGFSGGVETTHRIDDPGSWEVTGANGVGGVRRRRSGPVPPSSPASSLSSPAAAASGRACARDAEPQQEPAPNTKQRRSVREPDRWEAWTMTARGVTSTHELSADNLGLPADASGPACRLARNAVAVSVADVIVLVQLGKQLRDDDNGGEGALSRPTHGRLSRRSSRIGRAPAIG